MDVIGGTIQFFSALPGILAGVWTTAGFSICVLLLVFLIHIPFRNMLAGKPLLDGLLQKVASGMVYALMLVLVGALFGMCWMGMILGCG